MKTLREKAQVLVDIAQDWFTGKERELHQGSAALHLATAAELETLRERVRRLEEHEQ